MKRRCKTIVSCLLAFAMLIGMTATCLAANNLTIKTVEILDGSDGNRVKETWDAANTNNWENPIGVQQSAEVIRITAQLTDASSTAAVSGGAATYLAYNKLVDAPVEPLALENATIEFIDQMTTKSDGTVSFTYRNRSAIAPGTEITAKVGGVEVSNPVGFSYTVETDLPILSLTRGEGNFDFAKNSASDAASLTLSVNGKNALPETIQLYVGSSEEVSEELYSYSAGAIKINPDFLNELNVGKHFIKVTADNYNEAFLADAFNVTIPAFSEEQENKVEAELDNTTIAPDPATGTVTIPSIESAEYGVEVSVAETDNNKVTVSGTTVSLKEGQDFAKVTITVSVPGSKHVKTETVYMIPEGQEVGFGNIGLHTTGGSDSFAYTAPTGETDEEITAAKATINAAFTEYITRNASNVLDDIATALSIALDNSKANDLPHFDDALNFDGEEGFSLAEYRIYRLLMKGNDSVHTFTAVNDARNRYRSN